LRGVLNSTAETGAAAGHVPRTCNPDIGVSTPASLLVAAKTRILGEALGDLFVREGYEIHLAWPACNPATIVAKARSVRATLVLIEHPTSTIGRAMAEAIAGLRCDRTPVVLMGSGPAASHAADGVAVYDWASRSDSLYSLIETVKRAVPPSLVPFPRDGLPVVAPLADQLRRQESSPNRRFDLLTSREQQVLIELMDGVTAAEIARRSFMSPSTVRHHIRSILSKLNVNSQLAAVVAAYQCGWPQSRPPSL
jgi:two-component system, NarL family, nitrate/nitrite response regulator NarL